MKRLLLTFFFAISLSFAVCPDSGAVHKATGNFAVDLLGPMDTRPSTWGHADAITKAMVFYPPAGCAVQVVRVMGDFVAWPITYDWNGNRLSPPPPGTQAGTLLGLTPTNVTVSDYCNLLEDSSFLYIQVATDGSTVRVPFDQDVIDGYLGSDNTLNVTFADWLNNTGLIIHMEATFQVRFRFVDTPPEPSPVRQRLKTKWMSSR